VQEVYYSLMSVYDNNMASPPMQRLLLNWFKKHGRNLPWRKDHSPYKVWLSEVMLQQTQVATVIPYFESWLETFPTVQALAKAPLDKVLKQWEGLGYYRRARLLYQTANILSKKGFPQTFETWLELPGIGPYTAAAISSIVNQQKVVAVDGNVKRVVARVFALSQVSEVLAQQQLEPLIPKKNPGDFNEAMMELGATICTPKNPKCPSCPIQKYCQAFLQERIADFPRAKTKTTIPHQKKYALIYLKKNQLCLRQREPNEMLGGLWGFVLEDKKLKGKSLPKVKHAYTHFRLTVTPVVVSQKPSAGKLVKLKQIDNLALSTLDYKILDVLKQQDIL
jgi:A/G-specific adenine glycosylase